MQIFTPDTKNEMFQLAVQLVNQSNRNIFLTGKAGTGKTTFLKYIRENCPKQMAVVAPTGVAAINAGGVTIHSFFQLPLSPFIPETRGTGFQTADQEISNKHSLLSRLRLNSEKKKLLQQLELLVIDEISMVRCDTLDAIDTVLRHIRYRPSEPFGGVQLLFIGDLLQLPPVIKEQEWSLLSQYYNGQYFFDSKVLQDQPPLYIEFNKIYRQSDEQFISLLNQVRNNALDEEGYRLLESRFNPAFRRRKKDGYIILTTHNNKAAEINTNELANLTSKLFTYEAEVQQEFSDRAYPADELLQLKAGAQVMFIRNDSADRGKRYFNGKTGFISKLENDKIFVQCDDEPVEIEVQKETWENIRYTVNKITRQLEADVLGSFTQYPLRLAWAITIHKSQGLTFEKAIIDAGGAFAPGQVYVALSRCTNLEGMVLQSRVRPSSLFSDRRIVEFSQTNSTSQQLQQALLTGKNSYLLSVLLSLFDFGSVFNSTREVLAYLHEHVSAFNAGAISDTEELYVNLGKLQEMATKFHAQLRFLFQQSENAEESLPLQERIQAAATYFVKEINTTIQLLQPSTVVTDSRLHAKEYNDSIREVFAQLSAKKFLLEGVEGSFTLELYQLRKRQFVLPSFSVNAYAGAAQRKTDSPNPALHLQLRKTRDAICERKNLPIYIVAGSHTIDEMTRYLPQSLTELRKISGFGAVKTEQYGQQFLNAILEYTRQHNLPSRMHEKKPKRERGERVKEDNAPSKKRKGATRELSFQLFKQGKSVAQIAAERKLTTGTIENHLLPYVANKEINIDDLVPIEKQTAIARVLKDFDGQATAPIKERLGEDFSFGDIRFVMAALGIVREKHQG